MAAGERKEGGMGDGVQSALRCLAASLLFFMLGHWAAVPCITVRALQRSSSSDEAEHGEPTSWWLTLMPLWAGCGLALFFELLSMCYALPLLRRVVYSTDARKRGEMETLLPVVKSIGVWNCCLPVVGVLPPMPFLLLILWFELLLCSWLEGTLGLDLMVVFVPLFAVEMLGICHFLFMATHSIFAGASVVATTVFSLFLPLKVVGELGFSWWGVFAPLFALWMTWFVSALHILAHHSTDGGRVVLSRLQVVCLSLFVLSLLCLVVACVLTCLFLEGAADVSAGAPGVAWAAAGCFMAGGALFGGPILVICWRHLNDSVLDGVEVPRRLGAGWESDVGTEEWLCLGFVALKPGTGNHLQELASCAACTSGRAGTMDGADEESNPLLREEYEQEPWQRAARVGNAGGRRSSVSRKES